MGDIAITGSRCSPGLAHFPYRQEESSPSDGAASCFAATGGSLSAIRPDRIQLIQRCLSGVGGDADADEGIAGRSRRGLDSKGADRLMPHRAVASGAQGLRQALSTENSRSGPSCSACTAVSRGASRAWCAVDWNHGRPITASSRVSATSGTVACIPVSAITGATSGRPCGCSTVARRAITGSPTG